MSMVTLLMTAPNSRSLCLNFDGSLVTSVLTARVALASVVSRDEGGLDHAGQWHWWWLKARLAATVEKRLAGAGTPAAPSVCRTSVPAVALRVSAKECCHAVVHAPVRGSRGTPKHKQSTVYTANIIVSNKHTEAKASKYKTRKPENQKKPVQREHTRLQNPGPRDSPSHACGLGTPLNGMI